MRQIYQIFRPGQPRAVCFTSGLLALAMFACMMLHSSAMPCSSPAIEPAIEHVGALASERPPEVRLRRLHLVRPDLIPYPIIYEIFC